MILLQSFIICKLIANMLSVFGVRRPQSKKKIEKKSRIKLSSFFKLNLLKKVFMSFQPLGIWLSDVVTVSRISKNWKKSWSEIGTYIVSSDQNFPHFLMYFLTLFFKIKEKRLANPIVRCPKLKPAWKPFSS